MKRIYLILIAAVAITFTSCSDRDMDTVKPDTGQGAPIINLPEGASQGKIMVKFKPEAASFLDAAVTRSIGGAMTRSGISDMDVILQRIGTHKLERIFPIDNYVALYIPYTEEQIVRIVMIMYSGRDISEQLNMV